MNLYAKARLFLVLISICSWTSAADVPVKANQSGTIRLDFGVFWPPKDLSDTPAPDTKPLLKGCVILRSEHLPDRSLVAHVRIMLSRPLDGADREFWNSRLAFPEYDWMRYVRVWDTDNRWLWPNLPYLLRLHGIERVDRYGGVDPAKGVDNDFAATLIRKFDGSGQIEEEATKRTPLVSAEWYPLGVSAGLDKQSIVHTAQSDEFALHLGRPEGPPRGLAAVWLIYADFMGAKLPEAWPKAPEFAGGILAYFEVEWDLKAKPEYQIALRQTVPKRSTGFEWERWALRTRAAHDPKITAKLSDLTASNTGTSRPTQSRELEPGGAANQSQPDCLDSNSPPATAGSRR